MRIQDWFDSKYFSTTLKKREHGLTKVTVKPLAFATVTFPTQYDHIANPGKMKCVEDQVKSQLCYHMLEGMLEAGMDIRETLEQLEAEGGD